MNKPPCEKINIQTLYSTCEDADTEEKFNAITGCYELGFITIKDVPSEAPSSLDYFILARALALKVTLNENLIEHRPANEDRKGQWQRYWLRCCLSEKCDYYFAVFKSCGLNREIDAKELLAKGSPLWRYVNSDEGAIYYKRTVADWFLKRYNRTSAKEQIYSIDRSKRNISDRLKLWYPRLFGAIFVGFLPMVTQKDSWIVPIMIAQKVSWVMLAILSGVSFWLSFQYFKYEYHKTTLDTSSDRPKKIFLISLLYSFSLSLVFSILFTGYFLGPAGNDGVLKHPYWASLWLKNDYFGISLEVFLFFASTALLIGIFIQIFWEEKTVTEPL